MTIEKRTFRVPPGKAQVWIESTDSDGKVVRFHAYEIDHTDGVCEIYLEQDDPHTGSYKDLGPGVQHKKVHVNLSGVPVPRANGSVYRIELGPEQGEFILLERAVLESMIQSAWAVVQPTVMAAMTALDRMGLLPKGKS